MNDPSAPQTARASRGAGEGWARVAAALAPHLADAAGADASPVSVALELGAASVSPDEPLACRAWVERATRTLVFLGAEARAADGGLVASATAVFRRGGPR